MIKKETLLKQGYLYEKVNQAINRRVKLYKKHHAFCVESEENIRQIDQKIADLNREIQKLDKEIQVAKNQRKTNRFTCLAANVFKNRTHRSRKMEILRRTI